MCPTRIRVEKMSKTKTAFFVLGLILSMNFAFAQWTPAVFQGSTYSPQPVDYSTMRNSLQKQENRSNTASQKYSELAQLIGKKRSMISNDRETLEWFSENISIKLDDVKSALNVGDYHGAITKATEAIGEIEYNTELMRRIQTYEEYKEIVKYIQERTDLTYQQKQEWKNTYKYKFVPMYNTAGHVIGAYDWKDIGGPNNTRVLIP